MSTNANRHILLALGVSCTAKDEDNIFWGSVHIPGYVCLVLLSLTRLESSECCTACQIVCYSLFDVNFTSGISMTDVLCKG